jgi:hypothetical protein
MRYRLACLCAVLALGGFAATVTSQTLPPTPADAGMNPGDNVTWTKFSDPYENAFTVDVPAGWKVQGGMTRRSAIDVSAFLRAISPDGSAMILMGDPGPAAFRLPGYLAGPAARAYLPGQQFARQYAQTTLPSLCTGANFVSGADRQDIATGPFAKAEPGARYDAGEVNFTCTHNGQPTGAYWVAGTYTYPLAAEWGYNLLDGCVAPNNQIELMKRIILHMLLSMRSNPSWVNMEQGFVNAAARNLNGITAAQQRAFAANLANAQNTQAQMTRQYNTFSQFQTGTQPMPADIH